LKEILTKSMSLAALATINQVVKLLVRKLMIGGRFSPNYLKEENYNGCLFYIL